MNATSSFEDETTTPSASPSLLTQLSGIKEVLAVVAHPDDESFGLGGLLAALVNSGRRVRVLCLTHGEASTLGASTNLGQIRAAELACATKELKVAQVALEDWPDGHLADQDLDAIMARIDAEVGGADALISFEPSGITGHPDHQIATRLTAQIAKQRGLLLLEWGVPEAVASQLRQEFGAPITGLSPDTSVLASIAVDRVQQWAAIGCHTSQHPENAVLARRLELTGDQEWVRIHSAPFEERLKAFVGRIGPLAVHDATDAQRREVLDRLVGFATTGTPLGVLGRPTPAQEYTVRCLHDDPSGWTLAAVVTEGAHCTPPHDHSSWGAAATVEGLERNIRYRGSCPDSLTIIDEQLAPRGGGYLFAGGDIHQACDASGTLSVSLHLLVDGGPQAQQRCHEPKR